MVRELTGPLEGGGLRFGIVVSRFNRSVTASLLTGALEALAGHGVADDDILVAHVPGAFEIPYAAMRLAHAGQYDALICLGAVVRGETPHFDYICAEVTRGLGRIMDAHRLPIAFGVLTTDTIEQALARAGEGHGNKGYEAAVTAIEMVRLTRLLG
ncbi:MAG TPA: 6,7-dimethyl-8-ribityllumazine synthase [Kofleriaceae bacterium]